MLPRIVNCAWLNWVAAGMLNHKSTLLRAFFSVVLLLFSVFCFTVVKLFHRDKIELHTNIGDHVNAGTVANA